MRINNKKKEETEKCILCGRDTGVLRSTPIDQRAYYIEGCGQLCLGCHRSLKQESPLLSGKVFEIGR